MRKRLLEKILNTKQVRVPIWKSFDLIGDLVLLKAPISEAEIGLELLAEYKKVGEALLNELPYVKGVFLSLTPVMGEFRLRKVLHLAGTRRTWTYYREHGCVFKVDLESAYISPRLSYEHSRIAKLVRSGELIVNMFSGVGGFSIIIAKKANPARVISIDKNPAAHRLLVENVNLNHVEESVVPVLGDAVDAIMGSLKGVADRVLLPLPSFSPRFYLAALEALGDRGVLHFYEFVELEKEEKREGLIMKAYKRVETVLKQVMDCARAELLSGRIVRSVGPRLYQVSLDVFIDKMSCR